MISIIGSRVQAVTRLKIQRTRNLPQELNLTSYEDKETELLAPYINNNQ